MSSGWSSRLRSVSGRSFGILSKGIVLSIGMSMYLILLDFFLCEFADMLVNFFLLFNGYEIS